MHAIQTHYHELLPVSHKKLSIGYFFVIAGSLGRWRDRWDSLKKTNKTSHTPSLSLSRPIRRPKITPTHAMVALQLLMKAIMQTHTQNTFFFFFSDHATFISLSLFPPSTSHVRSFVLSTSPILDLDSRTPPPTFSLSLSLSLSLPFPQITRFVDDKGPKERDNEITTWYGKEACVMARALLSTFLA